MDRARKVEDFPRGDTKNKQCGGVTLAGATPIWVYGEQGGRRTEGRDIVAHGHAGH